MSRIIFNGNLFILILAALASQRGGHGTLFRAAVAITSFCIAYTYLQFFPASFEYGFYTSHDVTASAWFAGLAALVTGVLIGVGHKLKRA